MADKVEVCMCEKCGNEAEMNRFLPVDRGSGAIR